MGQRTGKRMYVLYRVRAWWALVAVRSSTWLRSRQLWQLGEIVSWERKIIDVP